MMIELSEEQRQELTSGEAVVVDPQTGEEYVLVRKAVYDRLRSLFEDDAGLSKREVSRLVDRMMREDDENDPSLHLYQDE